MDLWTFVSGRKKAKIGKIVKNGGSRWMIRIRNEFDQLY